MQNATEPKERTEPERDTSMDGGLCRLDPPGLANLDDDELAAPRHADRTED
jgi:hypothetical protein